MIYLAILAAAALIFGLFKLGNPLRPPAMPNPITPKNVDIALRHIAETYGHTEHDEAHDEADGPAPVPTPLATHQKRGRFRKSNTETITGRPPEGPKPKLAVLAGGLRIPAQIIYDRGHHINEARDVIILGALGQHKAAGDFQIQTVRRICNRAKGLRAFRLDHIKELIDSETGEVIPDVPAWLNAKLAALV